jgi:opacity protein-like surface antigen
VKQGELEMANRLISFGAACALLGALHSGPASAQFFTTGSYIRGDLGWSSARDAEIVDKDFDLDGFIENATATGPGSVNDIGSAYVLGIGAGARISPLFRGELVYSFRDGYELDDLDQFGNAYFADITSHSVMANVYWDIPFSVPGWQGLAPFVGAGIGWASNKFENFSTADGGTFFLPEGTASNLAWQIMAGLGIGLSPLTTLDIFYRYFDGGDLQTEEGEAFTTGGASAGLYTGARGELVAHEILVSLRFSFGP